MIKPVSCCMHCYNNGCQASCKCAFPKIKILGEESNTKKLETITDIRNGVYYDNWA